MQNNLYKKLEDALLAAVRVSTISESAWLIGKVEETILNKEDPSHLEQKLRAIVTRAQDSSDFQNYRLAA